MKRTSNPTQETTKVVSPQQPGSNESSFQRQFCRLWPSALEDPENVSAPRGVRIGRVCLKRYLKVID